MTLQTKLAHADSQTFFKFGWVKWHLTSANLNLRSVLGGLKSVDDVSYRISSCTCLHFWTFCKLIIFIADIMRQRPRSFSFLAVASSSCAWSRCTWTWHPWLSLCNTVSFSTSRSYPRRPSCKDTQFCSSLNWVRTKMCRFLWVSHAQMLSVANVLRPLPVILNAFSSCEKS